MHQSSSSASATAATLFREAAAAGRETLDAAQLATLLAGLGIAFEPAAVAEQPSALALRISLNNTREFGMVISAGMGGLDANLDENNFKRDRASVYAAAELTTAADFLTQFKRTLAWQRLAAATRRDGRPLPEQQLTACFENLLTLARACSPGNPAAPFVLRSLELNPAHAGDRLGVGAAQCEFGAAPAGRLPRPIAKIEKLIHPGSIGIIGVSSTNMNFGRIILKNLMGSGYPKEQMCIIRPGETEIDGVKCVESLKALDHKLDLLIVAVAASAVYELVDEIIETDSVESVMLIPGSLGETRASREPAAALAERINDRPRQTGRRSGVPRRKLPRRGLASRLLRFLVHPAGAPAQTAEKRPSATR